MKKIKNWLKRGFFASGGILLIIVGLNLLEFQRSGRARIHLATISSKVMFCVLSIWIVLIGILAIYLAYKEWKKSHRV